LGVLDKEQVDIVVRNMTMNCARWVDIGFSEVYYESGQKLLVRQDLADLPNPVDTVAELSGLRVCAPTGTTSLDNITKLAPKDTEIVTAINHTQCLVKFQRGEADAITGDDTVLAGLAAQDPYAVVPPGQEKFTAEPYGIGVNKNNKDLARFINAVLERSRDDGSWQESYDKWLRPTLGQGTQPQPTYGRG
jgi:polar amino acid transport system substrate-binding protein